MNRINDKKSKPQKKTTTGGLILKRSKVETKSKSKSQKKISAGGSVLKREEIETKSKPQKNISAGGSTLKRVETKSKSQKKISSEGLVSKMAEIENIDGMAPEIRDIDGLDEIVDNIELPDNGIIDVAGTEEDLVDEESAVKKDNKLYEPKSGTAEEIKKYTVWDKCAALEKFDDSYLQDSVEEEHVFCKFPEHTAAKKSLKEYLKVEDETLSMDLKVKEPRSFSPVEGSSSTIDTKTCKPKIKKTIREDDSFFEEVEDEAPKKVTKEKARSNVRPCPKFGEPKIPVRYNNAFRFLYMYKRAPKGKKVYFEKNEKPAPKNKPKKDEEENRAPKGRKVYFEKNEKPAPKNKPKKDEEENK